MPTLSTLALFLLAGAALIAVPGPNMIYVVTRSAGQGRAAGYASALGVELATLTHVALATVGLSALIASSEAAFDVVRYAGAAYLLLLGVRTLRERRVLTPVDGARARSSHARLVRDGMIVNLLNPKVVLFFLAFLPQFVDPARGGVAEQTLILGLLLAGLGLTADLLYATLADTVARRVRRARGGPTRDRLRWLTGGIYLSLGAFAALSGGRH